MWIFRTSLSLGESSPLILPLPQLYLLFFLFKISKPTISTLPSTFMWHVFSYPPWLMFPLVHAMSLPCFLVFTDIHFNLKNKA